MIGIFKMISYITDKGGLVFHYDPVLDNFEQAEKEALKKHGIDTDFLKSENGKFLRIRL